MLHIKIVQPASDNVEEATDALATEFMRLDVSFCGFDSEMTVVTAMHEGQALLGDRERVIPSIVQLVVKQSVKGATMKFAIGGGIVDDYTCFIFPIKALTTNGRTFPTSLIQLLRSEKLVKAAVGIRNDLNMLSGALGFQIGAPLEIQSLAIVAGASDLGLGALAERFTPLKKAPSAGGNYDGILSSQQIHYASLDALISHLIVEKLMASSIVLEKSEKVIIMSEEEMKLMWGFLRGKTSILSTATGSDSEKFVNQFYSGYSDWKSRGYPMSSIRAAVGQFLSWAVETGKLVNPSKGIYRSASLVPPAPKPAVVKQTEKRPVPDDFNELLVSANDLLQKHITSKGVTRNGILVFLKNQFAFKPPIPEDKQAQNIVDELITGGQLLLDSKTRKYMLYYNL